MKRSDFPADFVFATATSSYQIEGGVREGGRGPSIWDTFCHTEGKIKNGDTGDVACDHFHLWEEDLERMVDLGVNAYRFSVAWSRIFPEGKGRVNQEGVDFYSRIVDKLLEKKIDPWVTLYHWDLPQGLQDDRLGWLNRDTAYHFADYAAECGKQLGDRVKNWITLNEPVCTAFRGHFHGRHAPGFTDFGLGVKSSHVVNLAHGLGIKALRENVQDGNLGVTLNLYPVHPATPAHADVAAAWRQDGFYNRWFLDPVLGRGYPKDMLELYKDFPPEIQDGDEKLIGQPIDFLGVNYYFRYVIRDNPNVPVLRLDEVNVGGNRTYFDWEVYPQGLVETCERLSRESDLPLYITENGASYVDVLEADGSVHDEKRKIFIEKHLEACLQSVELGYNLKGYFAWSMLDNFEWAQGYDKRFGLYYIDFQNQKRYLKDSGKYYRSFLKGLDQN